VSRSQVEANLTTSKLPASVPGPLHLGTVAARARTLLEAARPRQWTKNLLVFAAPVAAGAITDSGRLERTIGAFWIFVAASACIYLVNDVIDRESDRRHPTKGNRPVASGRLAPFSAITVAILLGVASVTAAAFVDLALAVIVIAYLSVSLVYSLGLKGVPFVELVCVGSGFTLRAVAGGAAAHVVISSWFLVMTSFGALFTVAGKRSSEQSLLGDERRSHRRVLGFYPASVLTGLRLLAMVGTVTTYCLWVFERAADLRPSDRAEDLIFFELSIVPFVLAMVALERAFSRGRGGQPEELALSDRVLQMFGLAWVALLLCGIYA
jgi:decaprenyl-phosphate phosphoribosyltransferase